MPEQLLPVPVTLLYVELENFRNFPSLGLRLDPRGAVLEAPNGCGKTNFLEALYYLGLFRSFRGAADAELVTFGERGFWIRGEVQDGGGTHHGIGVSVEGARKRLAVDGHKGRPTEHVGRALSVVLAPEDIRLVQGSPSRRRRYLDATLALSSARYLRALQQYRRALKQRNRLLQSGSTPAAALLEPWTEQLARHGAVILGGRRQFVSAWGGRFGEISQRIAGADSGALGWCYESVVAACADGGARAAWAGGPEPSRLSTESSAEEETALERALRAELERRAAAERCVGATLVGPHRDDLSFFSLPAGGGAARDLRKFGSQGEQRTAALALRFVEAEVLTRERRELPVVLLDDVFSELDPQRSRALLGFLAPGQQVFLTTPKPLALDLPVDLPRYSVAGGEVRAA